MVINKPLLPPKAGYVERLNASGEHYYAPTKETMDKLAAEESKLALQQDQDAFMVDHEYRLTLLELGVI